jgi:TetR/AcrR family transcriptional regulator, cholesterol catabolism regulator
MPKPAKLAARRPRGTLTDELILDVSSKLYRERGYDRTNLDDVASALSVTKPSLYYYFRNKEEILLACISAAYARTREGLARVDDPAYSGRRRVELMMRIYMEVISDDTGVSIVLADERVMSETGQKQYREMRRELNAALEKRVAQGVADGSLATTDVSLTAAAIFGMFNWVSHWSSARRAAAAPEAISDHFLALIFDGLASRPESR